MTCQLFFSSSLHSKSLQHQLTRQQQCLLVCVVSNIGNCEGRVYILCGPTDWRVPCEETVSITSPSPICVCVCVCNIEHAENLEKQE